MNNLLITGTSGFIGKNLLNYIYENINGEYNIILLSSENNSDYTTILHKNYSFGTDDFKSKGVDRIDVLLHIGAFTPKSGSEANDIERSNANIINTKYLLDNLPTTPLKIVFLSTIDVYGKVGSTISESCETKPLSMYGWSKLYCENMIASWAQKNQVIFQLLRVGHIYGKGESAYKKVIPVTIQRLKNGLSPQIYGCGQEKRSFLHVDDVCNLIMKSIDLKKNEGVINLCSSKSYTVKEIIEMLVKISYKNIAIDFINNEVVGLDFEFDTSKMNQLLGFEKINITDGLRDEYCQ
jgi:UDP-glucose 4-epimerase